jgi:hypothetical protein
VTLHPDFDTLPVTPGESHITARHELFDLVNLITFGGAAERPTHVPAQLADLGPFVLWESTGAADQLPFWNTNFDGDAWLYIVHGSVRVEFKQTEGAQRYGHYLARTGDLFRLPRDVAHRTFSGDGRRRITLEILPRNPFWDTLGTAPVVPADGARIGGFAFDLADDAVVVRSPDGELREPRELFLSGLRALVAYELHLGLNEFDGGFVVHDLGADVELKAGGYAERLPGHDVLAVFAGLLRKGVGP